MGRFFLFMEVNPGEKSPVTWGLKRLKYESQGKFPPHRLPPKSESPANQPINEVYAQMKTPTWNKTIAIEYIYAGYNSKG
jgi:hypothetical protein